MSSLTPEGMLAIEEIVQTLEVVLNSFADQADRMRKRMIEAGWSAEAAETFVVSTTTPMVGITMANAVSPDAPEVTLKEARPSILARWLPYLIFANVIVVITNLYVLARWPA